MHALQDLVIQRNGELGKLKFWKGGLPNQPCARKYRNWGRCLPAVDGFISDAQIRLDA